MFEIRFIDENNYHPCGSLHTKLIKDLKTIRGVVNRIKTNCYDLPANWFKVVVLKYDEQYIYNEDMKKEVLELYKKDI